jgi:hypothetical protein
VSPARSLTTARSSPPTAVLLASRGSNYETKAVFKCGPRPNGAAIVTRTGVGIAACIGDDRTGPTLHAIDLKDGGQRTIDLPGRPRWCVTDLAAERVFLCIREPSMVLVARLPDLGDVVHWTLSSGGAHSLDIDHGGHRLYAACDDGTLVEIETGSGKVTSVWPIAGVPDVTLFNPATGLVHVAIGEPGLVETIDPKTGSSVRTMSGAGAHTTAIVVPDRLYVISPKHGGVLVLADE